MNNQSVYIIDALRTPMGRVNGKLRGFSLSFLMSAVVQAFVKKHLLDQRPVDEVIMGNAVSAGAGQNFVRKALVDAGLPEDVPGYAVHSVCASGLQAVFNACRAIRLRDADLIVAGGAESVSHMPELIFKKNHDLKKMKNLTGSLMHDGLWCSVADRWMGLLCEDMARKEKISKREQDDYAFGSYQKAALSQEKGGFFDEMIPIKMGGEKVCDTDETIRRNVTREIFDTFDGAFEYKGTVTAANSAAPCDGAAGILLASQNAVEKWPFTPVAEIAGFVSVAGPAKDIFCLPRKAIQACLKKTGISLPQIDLFGVSEAFAAQMCFLQKNFEIPEDKLNVCGGDIALGHPLGASGIRTLVTLVHALKRRRKCYGLACVSFGGGGALAVIVKNYSNGLCYEKAEIFNEAAR